MNNTAENALPQNKMANEQIPELLLTMSLPIMLSMLLEALYNVVDSLYVARISENALAALTLAFPAQLLVISITVGTSVGINASLSRMLGARDAKGVNCVAGNGIFLAAITYLLFLFAGIFAVKPYFAWQTSEPEIYRMATDYLSVCMIFSFGCVGQIVFQKLLQSTGKTMLSMISQLIGAVINIILDPILIFGYFKIPAMGIRGAAVATVIGQIIAMGVVIVFNLKKNKEIEFSLNYMKPKLEIVKEIYKVGAPSIVMQSLNSFQSFGVNFILIRQSSTAVAAFGVFQKIQNFIFMPAFGLNNGMIAILAYNYGAKKRKRMDATMKCGVLYSMCIMVMGMIVIQLFATWIMRMFGASEAMMGIGVAAMRIISLGYIFVAFTLIAQGIFQALGNGLFSLIMTLMRVVVVLLPVLYVFSIIMPLNSIWWAFVIAEAATGVVGVILLRRIYSKRVKPIVD